jgi:hypothetical protein
MAALSHYACDNGASPGVNNGASPGLNTVGPSSLRPRPGPVSVARGDFVQPAVIDPIFVPGGICPTVPPFLAPFTLVFEGDGRSDRFFSHVQMQFVDHFGVRAGSMVLNQAQLVAQFGSTAIPTSGTRAFPVTFQFGCVGTPTGLLTVVASDMDAFGRETSRRIQVPVR